MFASPQIHMLIPASPRHGTAWDGGLWEGFKISRGHTRGAEWNVSCRGSPEGAGPLSARPHARTEGDLSSPQPGAGSLPEADHAGTPVLDVRPPELRGIDSCC